MDRANEELGDLLCGAHIEYLDSNFGGKPLNVFLTYMLVSLPLVNLH